jgi:hypothetical protein
VPYIKAGIFKTGFDLGLISKDDAITGIKYPICEVIVILLE